MKNITLIILPVLPQPSGKSRYSPLDGDWLNQPLDGLMLPKISDLEHFCPHGQPCDIMTIGEMNFRIEDIWIRRLWDVTASKLDKAGFGEDGLSKFAAQWDKDNPATPFDSNPWAWFIGVGFVEEGK